jgi:hypothetical protein
MELALASLLRLHHQEESRQVALQRGTEHLSELLRLKSLEAVEPMSMIPKKCQLVARMTLMMDMTDMTVTTNTTHRVLPRRLCHQDMVRGPRLRRLLEVTEQRGP